MKTKKEILDKHIKDSQWYAPVCDERIYKAMEEYAAQTRDEMCEFIEWLIKEESFYGELSEKYLISPTADLDFETIQEAFEYWQLNIQGK